MMNDSLFCNVSLKTERLTVRPFELCDDQQLHSVVSQPEVVRFLPEDVMTLEEVREIINWLQTCYQRNTPEKIRKWTLAVVWNRTSQVIGWCGLGPLDFSPSEIELFCGLSKSYWGQGIAAEACRAVLDYAFNNIGLTRVVAVVDPKNLQSRRLIEKLEMQFEKKVDGLPEEFRHYEGFLFYQLKRNSRNAQTTP